MAELIEDQAMLFLLGGLVLIAIDIFAVGVSPLMFIAAGALLTSALIHLGWVDTGLLEALLICGLLSLVSAGIGWYPLGRFQQTVPRQAIGSDLVGRELDTTASVTKRAGTIRWSGTEWQARLVANADQDSVPPGTRVMITAVEGVTLILSPVD